VRSEGEGRVTTALGAVTSAAVSIRSARAHDLFADAPPDELMRVERRVHAMQDGARRKAKRGRAYVVDDDLEKRAAYMVLVALAGPAGGVAILPGIDPLVRWSVVSTSVGAASALIAWIAKRTTSPLPVPVVGRVTETRVDGARRVARYRYVFDDLVRHGELVDGPPLAVGALVGVLVEPRRPERSDAFVVDVEEAP
jgi:hypothetical protein